MRENFTQSMAKQVEAQAHFRPSILSLDTCILSYGCHMPSCFHMTPPWPPFGLDRFLSLVQVHLRSNVVRVCSSFWSSIMANFPSCSHHAIGKEVKFPKFQFSPNSQEQVRIRSTWACFDHISLIRPWNSTPFFSMDSLFFKEHSVKISNFLSTGSTSSLSFSLGRNHRSKS